MDLIVRGVMAGVLGTVAMDCLNHLFARFGMLTKVDVGAIGKMSSGWVHGRFFYAHPGEMKPVAHELLLGYFTHYAIGLGLAIPFVYGWDLLFGGPASPLWALIYGIATTVASLFIVFPMMGLGACGKRSPDGMRGPLSSLANHFFFGLGMALAMIISP
jgi:Protein of unknown function (DUF2938)